MRADLAASLPSRNPTVKFFADYNNLVLLAVAVVSGLLLVW